MSDINYKFKLLTKDELIISLDRLSRFKHPDFAYYRVFKDIIHKCCLEPHFSDREIDSVPKKEISRYCAKIWNKSVLNLFGESKFDFECWCLLKKMSDFSFVIDGKNTKELMSCQLNFASILEELNYSSIPLNLLFLKKSYEKLKISNILTDKFLMKLRFENSLLYPVQKLVIVEGITEDILLPVFAKKLDKCFKKLGIFVLSAGGKTKIPVIYNDLKYLLKIPVILIFDADAKDICENFKSSILSKDKMIINQKGEFEDLLSLNLIKRTINNFYSDSDKILIDELREDSSMCKNLDNYFRTRNIGEFKKAHFAKLIAENLKYPSDISSDIQELIEEIVSF